MIVERELAISILKHTREGPIAHEVIKKETRTGTDILGELLQKMQAHGLIFVGRNFIRASSPERLKLAVHAIELGADVERVASLLEWQEFESMAAVAFERNDYSVHKNLRFKNPERKWEIDIVGLRRPFVVCADCKHWHHRLPLSALKKIAQEQTDRVSAMGKLLPRLKRKIGCAAWETIVFVPAILTLFAGEYRFCDNVPVVSILQLQDFLYQLPAMHAYTSRFEARPQSP